MILDQGRPNGWSQSRALPTPIWRLGVPCEGTVRDPPDSQRSQRRPWPDTLGPGSRPARLDRVGSLC